jgi:hypothetical protein
MTDHYYCKICEKNIVNGITRSFHMKNSHTKLINEFIESNFIWVHDNEHRILAEQSEYDKEMDVV